MEPITQGILDKVDGAVLILTNECSLYESIKGLGDTQNDLTDFLSRICRATETYKIVRRTSNPDKRLQAYIVYAMWRHYEKPVSTLLERDKHNPGSIMHPHWMQLHEALNNKPQPTKEKEEPMSTTTVPFETKHYVFGIDVSKMDTNQLIEAVKKIEGEIENLKSVKTKSKTITAKVKELEGMLASVVKVLDGETV